MSILLTLRVFTNCSGVSIVDFEQVNGVWVNTLIYSLYFQFWTSVFQLVKHKTCLVSISSLKNYRYVYLGSYFYQLCKVFGYYKDSLSEAVTWKFAGLACNFTKKRHHAFIILQILKSLTENISRRNLRKTAHGFSDCMARCDKMAWKIRKKYLQVLRQKLVWDIEREKIII